MGVVVVQIRSTAGEAAHEVRRQGAVQIGRAPDNDVVLADPMASWRHALVYLDGTELWVRDLGSRNGTRVDGDRIEHPTRLHAQSRISVGDVELTVRSQADGYGALAVEEVASGVRHPILGERFVIGAQEGVHLRHPDVSEPLTLILVGHGEIWAGHDGEDRPVQLGVPFDVDGVSFVLRPGDPLREPTVEAQGQPYAYGLEASLDRGPGPLAVLSDSRTGHACRFTAETRAVMLYTLGRQILEDRARAVDPTDEGWVEDASLVVAVWGRTSATEGRTRLKTLVHRVRHDCRSAGLDPWCIEKRSGHTRLRAHTVALPGHPEA
ncbi:MAG: FHA domain-containing protein [Myxococcota bacterium]